MVQSRVAKRTEMCQCRNSLGPPPVQTVGEGRDRGLPPPTPRSNGAPPQRSQGPQSNALADPIPPPPLSVAGSVPLMALQKGRACQ